MDLIEYIKKYGNQSFDKRPFNDVDAAVFTTLCYAKFESIIPNIIERKQGIPISSISQEQIEILSKVNTFSKTIVEMINSMKESSRFKDVIIENSMSVKDPDVLEQFFAISYIIPSVGLLVSFRGTDGTTIGWKENFTVLYKGAILSQIDAIEYLNQVNIIHPQENYMITGHSKGGNLSLYSLFYGTEKIKNKITHVYSFDGYGFTSKDFKESKNYNELVSKLTQIVPGESIIGELFYTPLKYKIIKASGKGVSEHHPLNWFINESGEFEELSRRSFKSRFFHRVVKKWSQRGSKYSFQVFVDIIVEALKNENGEFEIGSSGNNPIKKILKVAKKRTIKEKIRFFGLSMNLFFVSIECFFYYFFCQLSIALRFNKKTN